MSLNADHKYFYLKVEDSGLGIPQEDQAHIFERFYRVDKSHSREIGGTGLGLATVSYTHLDCFPFITAVTQLKVWFYCF